MEEGFKQLENDTLNSMRRDARSDLMKALTQMEKDISKSSHTREELLDAMFNVLLKKKVYDAFEEECDTRGIIG